MQRLVAWEALRVQQPAVVDAAHVSRHWDKDKLVLALCERGVVDPYLQHLQKAELRALFLRSSTRDGELSAEMGVAVGEAAASLLARRLTVPVVGESPDAAALRHSAQVQRDHLQRPLEQLSPEARAALQARWSADVAKRRLALYRARQQGEAAAGVCAAQVHEEHRIGELLAEHRRGLRRVLCGPRVEQPVGRRAADICSGAVQVLPLVSAAVHMAEELQAAEKRGDDVEQRVAVIDAAHKPPDAGPRTCDAPAATSEVLVGIPSELGTGTWGSFHLKLRHPVVGSDGERRRYLRTMSPDNRACDPTHFVLLFPAGHPAGGFALCAVVLLLLLLLLLVFAVCCVSVCAGALCRWQG
jgi:hypothetical protein